MQLIKTIVTVISFLTVFVSSILYNITSHCGPSKLKRAQLRLQQIELSIEEFYLDTNTPPRSIDDLLYDNQAKFWLGPYIKPSWLIDPWGTPFQYQLHENPTVYVLYTLGSDAKPGGTELATDLFNANTLPVNDD